MTKERNDFSKTEIQENIKTFSENRKRIEQKIKEIEATRKDNTEGLVKQLKDAFRGEKSWKNKLKELEGESDVEENDQEENKRENPTMEKIQSRVTEMINSKQTSPLVRWHMF